MNDNHPLTEDAATELWDAGRDPKDPWVVHSVSVVRISFDAGREYEREHATQARPAEITDEMVEAARKHIAATEFPHIRDTLNAALSAALAVAAPADPRHDPRPWQDCTREDIREGDLVERRTKDLVIVGVAHRQDGDGDWWTKDDLLLTCGDRWPLRRIPATTTEKGTPMTETTTPAEPLARTLLGVPEGYGASHHDAGRIKADDFVLQVDRDGSIRGGLANHQDRDGDWRSKEDMCITWAAFRADRPDALTVWPAPTPPAVEVEMPTKPGSVLTDVSLVLSNGVTIHADVAMLDDQGYWQGRWGDDEESAFNGYPTGLITAFTLPDGTCARRDGEHPDGKPRFVKVKEGEK